MMWNLILLLVMLLYFFQFYVMNNKQKCKVNHVTPSVNPHKIDIYQYILSLTHHQLS